MYVNEAVFKLSSGSYFLSNWSVAKFFDWMPFLSFIRLAKISRRNRYI